LHPSPNDATPRASRQPDRLRRSLPARRIAVIQNYERYLATPESWILNRLVLPATKLNEVSIREDWRITLLTDTEPGPLPPQIETLESKAATKLSLPTYCEAPLDQIAGAFAKIRIGGLTPAADIATFLHQAAARRLPFKATAGLHHPIRANPDPTMHGFINVFTAAAFAWYGLDRESLIGVLEEIDPAAFLFDDDHLRWRGLVLATEQILAARRDFAHSFGSCSFEEPIDDLRNLKQLWRKF
jgi:hypothetical protein